MKVAEHSGTDGVLEALEEERGAGCGFVKTEAGFGVGEIGVRLTLEPIEEPADHGEVRVERCGKVV